MGRTKNTAKVTLKKARMADDLVIDLQGFRRTSGEFIFKELAIIGLRDGSLPIIYQFEPPFPRDRLSEEEMCSVKWLEQNHHGMSWEAGEIPYYKLFKLLRVHLSDAKKVYVKGPEKKDWLEEVVPNM